MPNLRGNNRVPRLLMTRLQHFFAQPIAEAFASFQFSSPFPLDVQRVNSTIQTLIRRHPYLQAVWLTNGQLQFEEKEFKVNYRDLSKTSKKAQKKSTNTAFQYLIDEGKHLQQGALFDVQLDHLGEKDVLTVLIALAINDGLSQVILGQEFLAIYFDQTNRLAALEFDKDEFNQINRQLNLNVERLPSSNWGEASDRFRKFHQVFWSKYDPTQTTRIHRIVQKLDQEEWDCIKNQLNVQAKTINAALLYHFAQSLKLFFELDDFAVCFVRSIRYRYPVKFQKTIGNFLDYVLLNFNEEAQDVLQDLNHFQQFFFKTLFQKPEAVKDAIPFYHYPNGPEGQRLVPVLFSANILGTDATSSKEAYPIERKALPRSVKTNVLLECQIFELTGQLYMVMDYHSTIFQRQIIESFLQTYRRQLQDAFVLVQ